MVFGVLSHASADLRMQDKQEVWYCTHEQTNPSHQRQIKVTIWHLTCLKISCPIPKKKKNETISTMIKRLSGVSGSVVHRCSHIPWQWVHVSQYMSKMKIHTMRRRRMEPSALSGSSMSTRRRVFPKCFPSFLKKNYSQSCVFAQETKHQGPEWVRNGDRQLVNKLPPSVNECESEWMWKGRCNLPCKSALRSQKD